MTLLERSDQQHNPESPGFKSSSPMVTRYFLVLFLISLFFLGRLLFPFWSILILSFLLAGIFKPVYNLLNRKFSPAFSSLVTCGLVFILVFVPLFMFVGALSKEALDLYQLSKGAQLDLGLKLKEMIEKSSIIANFRETLAGLGFNIRPEGVSDTLTDFSKITVQFIYKQASAWAANIMNFVINFFLMIIIIFFLLIDIDRLVDFLLKISPLPNEQDRQLIRKFEEIAGAVLIGNGICGILQGALGGAAFAFFGLGSPIVWGGIMVILAFLPIFGIGLVLIPAAIVLFVKGKIGSAIFMLIFYACLSFSVEYFLKPKIVGQQVKMHTLLVFLSILGGLSVFGVLGIIYGPLIVTGFLTLSEIYLQNYDSYVKTGNWPSEKME